MQGLCRGWRNGRIAEQWLRLRDCASEDASKKQSRFHKMLVNRTGRAIDEGKQSSRVLLPR